jgi:hypothetical protein
MPSLVLNEEPVVVVGIPVQEGNAREKVLRIHL